MTTTQTPLTPKTTAEEDKTTEGQRDINRLWEHTQSKIALYVVLTNLGLNSILCLIVLVFRIDITANQLALISLCIQPVGLTTGIVIGFYFGRTNHTKVGGVGPKEHKDGMAKER